MPEHGSPNSVSLAVTVQLGAPRHIAATADVALPALHGPADTPQSPVDVPKLANSTSVITVVPGGQLRLSTLFSGTLLHNLAGVLPPPSPLGAAAATPPPLADDGAQLTAAASDLAVPKHGSPNVASLALTEQLDLPTQAAPRMALELLA